MTGAFTVKGEKRHKFVKFKVGEDWPPRFAKLEIQVPARLPPILFYVLCDCCLVLESLEGWRLSCLSPSLALRSFHGRIDSSLPAASVVSMVVPPVM